MPQPSRSLFVPIAHALGRTGPAITAFARWARPWCRRGGHAIGRGGLAVLAAASAHRVFVIGVGCRALWWSALWLLASAGADVLGFTIETVDDRLWHPFAIGLGLCAAVVLFARERHVRWLATGLGTTHAALGLLAFSALHG